MQCNTMQCNAMQCNAMQCNAMQCNAMQCNAMQCNAMQCIAMFVKTRTRSRTPAATLSIYLKRGHFFRLCNLKKNQITHQTHNLKHFLATMFSYL